MRQKHFKIKVLMQTLFSGSLLEISIVMRCFRVERREINCAQGKRFCDKSYQHFKFYSFKSFQLAGVRLQLNETQNSKCLSIKAAESIQNIQLLLILKCTIMKFIICCFLALIAVIVSSRKFNFNE
jgi:hypothetical protein